MEDEGNPYRKSRYKDSMKMVVSVVRNKPPIFVLITLLYLFVLGFGKWRLTPSSGALFYMIGGLCGIYFLDIAEQFFRLNPSPFRSVVFAAAFTITSFFVITSSGSLLASGLVLSLYVSLILLQLGEWRASGSMDSWFRMVAGPVSKPSQKWFLIVFIFLFLAETYLFIK